MLASVTGEILESAGVALASLRDAGSLTPGLALAARDHCPLIVVTDLHADAALLAPVVKATVVAEPASVGHWIAHAANLAMTDPRGPVHVACADAVASEPALPVATAMRPAPLPPPTAATLEALGDALALASRPLLLTGLECGPGDAKWVRAFAETLPAPVLATTKGRGVLPEPHPLALGLAEAGHPLLARADLVVLIGVDAMELPPGVLPARAVARIGRAAWPAGALPSAGNVPCVADVSGDIALAIEELAPRVRARPAADWDVAELDRLKRALMQRTRSTATSRLVALVREATPAGTVVTSDVPLGFAWQAVAPREVLTPLGGVLPPGYAGFAAVGAQLADRDRRVVAFTTPRARAATARALEMAETLALPIVVVELGRERDEAAFAATFSRAFVSREPALV
jgi:acetolactate synthase-1/2/3 large subunit